MKMADKTFGNIGIYKKDNIVSELKFWARMRIGCDIGRHLLTTKNYIFMMEYGKVTDAIDHLSQLTIGNIKYLWYKLTERG